MELIGTLIIEVVSDYIGARSRYVFFKLIGRSYYAKRCLADDNSVWNRLVGFGIVISIIFLTILIGINI